MSLLPCRVRLFLVACLCVATTPCCLAQGIGSGDNMTISDENVIIGFVMEQYTVTEGQDVEVCVNASMLMDAQSVEVSLATQDGTALSGTHYEDTMEVLTFSGPMDSVQCVNITTLVNDAADDVQFSVSLSSLTSAQLTPNMTTVTVRNVPVPIIQMQPESVLDAVVGGVEVFTVVASGDQVLTYQWFMVETSGNVPIENATEAMFVIMEVTEDDEGIYFCTVSNGVSSVDTVMVELRLLPQPIINAGPMSAVVLINTDVTFSCDSDSNITWTIVRTMGGESVNVPMPVVDGNTSTITVNVGVAGEYIVTCIATNVRAMVTATATLNAIVIQVDDVTAGVSSTAEFFCNVTGISAADLGRILYSWNTSRNGIPTDSPFPSPHFDNRVDSNVADLRRILDVTRGDGDFNYDCIIQDISRNRVFVGSDSGSLTVIGPNITEPPVNQTLDVDDLLELNCTAVNNIDASRNLTFIWEFRSFNQAPTALFFESDDEVTVTYLGNRTFQSVLRVGQASPDNGGEYMCSVTNRPGSVDAVNASATVIVFFTPVLDFEPAPVVENNRNLTLTCMVTAQPNATFAEIARFSSDGERMVVASVNNTEEERMITVVYRFMATFRSDNGAVFQCLAENANGQTTLNASVIVQARPGIINMVTANLSSLNTINVTWTRPDENNSPITMYTVSYCQYFALDNCSFGDDTDLTFSDPELIRISDTVLRYVIPSIVPQQRYEVRVRASNAVGTQPSPMVGEGVDVSSASPMDGNVRNFSNITTSSLVILTWELPPLAVATNGLEVNFTVSYSDSGSDASPISVVVPYVPPAMNQEMMDLGVAIILPRNRGHTVSIVADYSNPVLTSEPVTLTDIELAQPNTPLMMGKAIGRTVGDVLTVEWPRPNNTNFLRAFVVSYNATSMANMDGRRRRRQATTPLEVRVDDPEATSTELNFMAFSTYEVNVDAVYSQPQDDSEVRVRLIPTSTIETPERVPGRPRLTSITNEGVLKIRIEWEPPQEPNGVIQRYIVRLNESEAVVALGGGAARSWISSELIPNTYYRVQVLAATAPGQGLPSNTLSTTTNFGVSQPFLSNPLVGTVETRQLSVTYGPGDNELGRVSRFSIVVIRGGGIEDTVSEITTSTLLPQNRTSLNYYVAISAAVPERMTTYTIGTGGTTSDGTNFYNNPPIDTGVNYQVFIRVFSGIDRRVFNDSALTGVLRISTPLNPAVIIAPIAAIAVILLVVLVVLLLVVFIFTRPRRGYTIAATREDGRHGKRGIELRRTRLFSPVVNVPIPDVFTSAGQPTTLVCEASGTPAPDVVWTQNDEPLDKERFIQLADSSLFINDTDLKDEGAYIVTATNSAGTAEQMVRVTVIRPSAPEPDPDHPPIKVGEFTEKIALIRAEDDEGLEDEYSELEPDVTFTSYAAKININKNKNRYINIIPYDHSRVVLSLQENTPGSDYINASYVDGFNRPNAYIATQGPQPSTFPDFWRMIWEFDCPTIVMVTNLKEEDKLKCHQYWPSYGTITYGSIQVTLKGVENLAEYSIRTFHITPIAGQSRVQMPVREVKQFHFLVWPDHGVPQFATPLLSFRKRVAKYHPDKKGPMVVHCSAGVGRTGTFITIDTMLRKMESEGIIDIFNFVRHMRFRRNYMVQTGPQYVFIHDAMLEAIMCGDNSMPAPEVKKRFQELMEVDPESNKTRLQLQFENLNSNSPQDDDFDCTIACLPDNMAKNRFKVHLPANDYRVPLGAPPTHSEVDEDADEDDEEKEKEEPDYICASFADGYRQRNAFIITQAPMTSTTGDFWKMIWEQKSAAIVMLTELEEDGKEMSVKYWPSEVGEAGLFGSFQLELSEDEKDKGDYVTRKFKLSHVDTPQDCRIVTQFHFTKWPRTSVPSNPQSVIDLIDEIQRVQRKSGNQPITIHCDDGVSRTGAFCTLYSVLERVKVDQVVDIYLATKTLRIQRAGVLETFDQYVFIHKAVLEFLESFSDYQNFK